VIKIRIFKNTIFFFAIVILLCFNSCKKEKSVLAEAKFTFSGNLEAIPTQIQFTNNSFGISYVWDFGDGTSSNEKNPSHTYNEYGLYKVKLTARGTNNIDTLVKDLLIGGNLGQISSLNCVNSTSTTKFTIGESYTDEIVNLPYTNGNGGVYNRLYLNSTGVTGLTAKLSSGKFNSGDGNLEFSISGTPSSKGIAKFKIDLVGKSCELNVFVLDTVANLPTVGLVGWWPFNGNANDESGNGNHGTVNGASLTNDLNGNNKSAIYQNINGSYIRTQKIIQNSANDFTISFWVSPNDTDIIKTQGITGGEGFGTMSVIHPTHGSNWGNAANNAGVGINVGKNQIQIVEHTHLFIASPLVHKVKITGWHNIVLIYDKHVPKLYIDGKFVASGLKSSIQNVNPSSGYCSVYNQSGFGNSFSPNGTPIGNYKGKYDDIGVWNRALTQQEITELYNLK
jgi:PKD repeat protein